ncbi:VOC family protein [Pacificimonas sp. WHA3]|uniref:VOC family protein n=1 Tax=Pacificimonas pallii TaxID=2827236 RepID=A0ABS6SD10_9SPHN|nr:VOC family protein [Pacificimonas pallii]MBV7255993.1 VOC family protein [Pacificimonas pallii]
MLKPFHLAFPVDDLDAARAFYGGVMGCAEARASDRWTDFNFFGHQIVTHLAPKGSVHRNPVGGDQVPVPHFGVVLGWDEFEALADRLRGKGVAFEIEPHVRFAGQVGEQMTMFLFDPAGNALEFKAMRTPENLFARDPA